MFKIPLRPVASHVRPTHCMRGQERAKKLLPERRVYESFCTMERLEFTPKWLGNLKPASDGPQCEVAATIINGLRVRAAVRRALDGHEGIRDLRDQPTLSLARANLAQHVQDRAKVAPISANRQLSDLKTVLSWCVDEELADTNVAETVKKPSADARYHKHCVS